MLVKKVNICTKRICSKLMLGYTTYSGRKGNNGIILMGYNVTNYAQTMLYIGCAITTSLKNHHCAI